MPSVEGQAHSACPTPITARTHTRPTTALSGTERAGDGNDVTAADARLRFVQENHRDALDALHCEVQLLQEKNADLAFKLTMTEQMSTDLVAARDKAARLEEREAQLMAALAQQTARAEAAEAKLANVGAAAIAPIREGNANVEASLRQQIAALERQLAQQATVASPPRPRVTYTEYSVSTSTVSSSSCATAGGAVLAPSPPRKSSGMLGARQRQHPLLRRASTALAVDPRPGPRSNPTPSHVMDAPIGSLPQYPEPVPPIRIAGDH
eukprot:m.55905 g.55905  ORF g.55905 m.55905 type:complete len:267 (+) comp7639_c0_seq2:300-1100(+)